MTDNIDIKLVIDAETGKVTFDIFEYLGELPEEKRIELLWDRGWWGFIYPELLKELRQGFSRRSYAEDIHKFRMSLLTDEHAPQLIREFAETIIADTASEVRYLRQWYDAFFKLYHHPELQDKNVHAIISALMPRERNTKLTEDSWAREFLRVMYEQNGIEFPPTPDEYHIDR